MKKIKPISIYRIIIQFFLCFCIIFSFPLTIVYSLSENIPDVNSLSAVLIDADSGIILFEKNKDEVLYPASITKIMTALLAVEHYNDTARRINFSHYAVFSLPYGSSHIAMNENETLSVNDAMLGLMLASANEVANAIAEDISGSIEDFAALMTIRAKELGTINTSFTNPHGLSDDNHYTTAYDMSLIMKEAVKYPEFLRYISTQSYNIPPTERQPLERPLNNTNKMIIPSSAFYNADIIGGKTGFTDESRHTLVTYASRNGINLIVAILHGEKNEPYNDTTALLNYGFSLYNDFTIIDSTGFIESINVSDSDGVSVGTAELIAKESITGLFPANIVPYIVPIVELSDELSADSQAGQHAGILKATYDGITLGQTQLIISKTDFVKPVQASKTNSSASPAEEQSNYETLQTQQTADSTDDPSINPAIIILIASAIVSAFIYYRHRQRRKRYRRYRSYGRMNINRGYSGYRRSQGYGRFKK